MAVDPVPVGADAVIPSRAGRLFEVRSRWRLAVARRRARGRLEIGSGVHMEHGARIAVDKDSTVRLCDGCFLGAGSRIHAVGGNVVVGKKALLGERSVIVALSGVTLGPRCVLGDWALVSDAEPGFDDSELPVREQPLERAPVHVGEGARIGAHAAVLSGVTVTPWAVVASYAVVRRAEPGRSARRRPS
jgi:acetyltransferase-like isoleucine patch superfamily enzyme